MPEYVLPTTARALLARTARAQREGRAPSLVAGVVRDGGLVWSTGRGDVPEQHTDVQYRLGSISKTVTAVAVMRLRDEGHLHLDDPLERHLPGTPFGDRTIGQLLSHLAGGLGGEPRRLVGAHPRWLARRPRPHRQTTSSSVLRAGSTTPTSASACSASCSLGPRGASWDDVVTAEVLAPLGMKRTTPRPVAPAAAGLAVHPWADVALPEPEHHAGVMAAAGQLWATAGRPGRLRRVPARRHRRRARPGHARGDDRPRGRRLIAPGWSAYGLGLQVLRVDGRTLVGHGGSMPGFLAGVFVDREEQTGAVSLANTTSGLDTVVFGLLDDLRTAEPRMVDAWTPSPSPLPLDQLGVWFWGPRRTRCARSAAGCCTWARCPAARAAPAGSPAGTTARGWGSTATSRARRCGSPRTTSNLDTFVFTRTPYDPRPRCPAAWTTAAGTDLAGVARARKPSPSHSADRLAPEDAGDVARRGPGERGERQRDRQARVAVAAVGHGHGAVDRHAAGPGAVAQPDVDGAVPAHPVARRPSGVAADREAWSPPVQAAYAGSSSTAAATASRVSPAVR